MPLIEDDVKQMFQDDVQEKKRNGIGVHSRTGSRGHTGRINMPTDFMSKKDRRNYTKPSKVRLTYMHETIMPLEQFQSLLKEDQKKMLLLYRKSHSTKDIQIAWSVEGTPMTDYRFYKLMDELSIAAKKTNPRHPKKTQPETVAIKQPTVEMIPMPTYAKASEFVTGMNGEYTADVIVARLLKFATFLEDEPGTFKIQLLIEK